MRIVPLALLGLAAAGLLAYSSSLDGEFVLDDRVSILENAHIESLWPLPRSLSAPPGTGASGRPLVALSLALNYALGGREVLGYHLFNIAVHVLAALALFGVVRRALIATGREAGSVATAFAVALLWVLHPLHTDALDHVVYRNETMMAAGYLASVYCALRAFASRDPRRWSVLCVVAAVLAVTSKEVAVSLPLAVLAFDRLFGAGTFRGALRARPWLYAGLAASWGVLALCVALGDRGESVGLGHSEIIDSFDYLRTQAQAILIYLRRSFWPAPLVFDYDGYPLVRQWGTVLLPGAVLVALLALCAILFARRHVAGLLGLAFFAVLAPSSSFIPLSGELVAEHRMVLPLAPLLALVVLGVDRLLRLAGARRRTTGGALLALAALALGATTFARNEVYRSRLELWSDTLAKRPDNPRAWNHYGIELKNAGRLDEAAEAFRRALGCNPEHGMAHYNYANLLLQEGKSVEALEHYALAARYEGREAAVHNNYGALLIETGRVAEGVRELVEAARIDPSLVRLLKRSAWILSTCPDDSVRDGARALELAREYDRRTGSADPRGLDILAAALAETGDFAGAVRIAQQARDLAVSTGRSELVGQIEERLRTYASGRAFRQSSDARDPG